jgi:transposase
MTLLADMPELGNLNDKQAASLMGVAPVARDSGTFQGKRHIRGGRAQVRQAVYMAALVVTRFNADMKRKYETLFRDGKPPKVALTVVMRKLIILANALIRDNRNWSEIRPCT